jgi:hypothetical protein
MTLIQIKPVMPFAVGCKINIRQPVIVDISYCNTPAVIIVDIPQDAEGIIFFRIVFKIDMCPGRRQVLE